jgi:hypothetical protein
MLRQCALLGSVFAVFLVACMGDDDEYLCHEDEHGTWHPGGLFERGWCESPRTYASSAPTPDGEACTAYTQEGDLPGVRVNGECVPLRPDAGDAGDASRLRDSGSMDAESGADGDT